ncbi:hypothetical protein FH609_011160 [Streptomyces sp. 3MP-14]|uniref:GH26 domain-containing protein n=1 Tax=Streptomyces mimosae TaxID=2586635 RepID=A0A5N6AFX6_9ACTN|nr:MULTISPECIES: hypothetical protein [Streptomyces]KAB8166963.1 hypothetical protein FH607_008610 [Streptomyces mimosae]KAB8176904.1 hypothetical protein FH609_011160 [Streptomyces sp. 3MP-14]
MRIRITAVCAAVLAVLVPAAASAVGTGTDPAAASTESSETTETTETTEQRAQPQAVDRELLIGQSSQAAWDDWATVGEAPAGGSVYYEVNSGTWVSEGHRQYAEFLAERGDTIQLGVSWKDNPPGFEGGDGDARAQRSREVTQELADGQYQDRFDTLVDFITANPQATYLVRLDYEVSSFFHCTDDSCASYRDAYNTLAAMFDERTGGANVQYVYHPVRGEYEKLYPGDANVDWMGLSIFAHELCLPIYDNGYLYNGTPPDNYDVEALQCRDVYIDEDEFGNPSAVWQNWDHDANVLRMTRFAQEHAKPMVLSEAGLLNFTEDGADTSGLEPELATEWVERLFGLLNYQGPIPGQEGEYDLSEVIRMVTYINLDFRYGWDGIPGEDFEFPPNSTWFVDGRLSQYGPATEAFCRGLAEQSFSTTCR